MHSDRWRKLRTAPVNGNRRELTSNMVEEHVIAIRQIPNATLVLCKTNKNREFLFDGYSARWDLSELYDLIYIPPDSEEENEEKLKEDDNKLEESKIGSFDKIDLIEPEDSDLLDDNKNTKDTSQTEINENVNKVMDKTKANNLLVEIKSKLFDLFKSLNNPTISPFDMWDIVLEDHKLKNNQKYLTLLNELKLPLTILGKLSRNNEDEDLDNYIQDNIFPEFCSKISDNVNEEDSNNYKKNDTKKSISSNQPKAKKLNMNESFRNLVEQSKIKNWREFQRKYGNRPEVKKLNNKKAESLFIEIINKLSNAQKNRLLEPHREYALLVQNFLNSDPNLKSIPLILLIKRFNDENAANEKYLAIKTSLERDAIFRQIHSKMKN